MHKDVATQGRGPPLRWGCLKIKTKTGLILYTLNAPKERAEKKREAWSYKSS